MLRFQWELKVIKSNADAETMRQLFKETTHNAAAFDTETNGLNIIRCKPFLFQFGWIDKTTMKGYAFAVDLERQPILSRQVITVWHALVKTVPKYYGQNVKFDLHMCTNIGLPYDGNNISDTQALIRLGSDAIPERKGGVPLALKKFAKRYIDSSAKDHEDLLSEERTKIAKELNANLRKQLGWTQKQIEKFFNDALNEVEDLPEDKRKAYQSWHDQLPEYLKPIVTGTVDSEMITYDTLNRENVTRYALYDIVWTLEIADLMYTIVEARDNLGALAIDESNIYPVYEMERVGFKADREYLYQCKAVTKQYIRTRRQDLCTLAGRQISVGQHELIKEILHDLGVDVNSTGADELDLLVPKLKAQGDRETAVDFIEAVQELRTLEKWYSTYIMRFIVDLKYGDMLYSEINLHGAVSGRVTSDFQQFPKGNLLTYDGQELFSPRKLFLVPDGYMATVYLDYSQIELRLQAMYTILVAGGDLNLCRAYMPFKCFRPLDEVFNPRNPEHIKAAYDGSWWKLEGGDEKWTPTDVHSATTKTAFGIDESDEQFSILRGIGKKLNFAKQYGAQKGKVKEMFPDFDDATIEVVNDAYYKTFPGVKAYHDYCYRLALQQAYAQNLFGRKYYNTSGHEYINMMIQGTGADVLKTIIPKVNHYLKEYGYKSVLGMQIHDEIWVHWHPADSAEIFFKIKEIMQDFVDFYVPLVAEMEVTTTSWHDKKKVKTIEELNKVCVGY